MMSMKARILLVSASSLLLANVCHAEQLVGAAAAANDVIEAKVNGVAITKSRVDMLARQDGVQADSPEARRNIIDKLTLQMLVADEAVRIGMDKSVELIEQLELARQSVLATAYVQEFTKNNPVSEDTLKTEYERIKSSMAGNEYKARHILVKKESEAKDIIAKLKKNPGSFAKLAMEKSEDSSSQTKGGDLGWIVPKQVVPEFAAAVSKLEKGKFTQEPVLTAFGYHIILLEASRPIQPPPFEEIKAELTQHFQQQGVVKELDDLKAKARIEILAVPAASLTPASAPAADASR